MGKGSYRHRETDYEMHSKKYWRIFWLSAAEKGQRRDSREICIYHESLSSVTN